MPSIKEYNKRIASLKNTRKMTKTMKMVSASKLRKIQKAQANAKIYALTLTGLIGRIAASVEQASHPLLQQRPQIKNVLIFVLTSDRGLAGGFNNNLIKFIRTWIRTNKEKYKNIDLTFAGKRGYLALYRTTKTLNHYEGVTAKPDFTNASKIVEDLTREFNQKNYDEVYIAFNDFKSPILQTPRLDKLLPIDPAFLNKDTEAKAGEYIFEPPQTELLNLLIPRYVQFKIYNSLLENSAGEHGARMAAMDNATRNSSDLIDKYTLLRNRARQASITKELIEIISGAEALK